MKPTISLFWYQIDEPTAGGCYVQARYGAGPVVGQLRLEINDGAGWIAVLYVAPGYRGQGLATLLIQRCYCICRQRGLASIGLTVHHENETAQRVYRRLGFVRYLNGYKDYQQLIKVLT